MCNLDALPVDVLTKCVEFLPFDETHTTAKRVSRGLRSAARRALTRGRWRPLKEFCKIGYSELFGETILVTVPSDATEGFEFSRAVVCDQTRDLFREVWALEPSEVLIEMANWPTPPDGLQMTEGAMRFLDIVEPSIDGFGRIRRPSHVKRHAGPSHSLFMKNFRLISI